MEVIDCKAFYKSVYKHIQTTYSFDIEFAIRLKFMHMVVLDVNIPNT